MNRATFCNQNHIDQDLRSNLEVPRQMTDDGRVSFDDFGGHDTTPILRNKERKLLGMLIVVKKGSDFPYPQNMSIISKHLCDNFIFGNKS